MTLLLGLEITGVGPYQSKQTMSLGPGINVIEGENGTGKTSLFQALNFAIYGTPPPGATSLKGLVNESNRQRGNSTFKTVLRFQFDDEEGTHAAEVTRRFSESEDPDSETIVSVNGVTLAAKPGEDLLRRLFPPNLASFHFFEAERLEEYQAAAGGGPRAADVPRTVERLLGIPALDNAETDVSKARQEATTKIAEADAQNQNVQKRTQTLAMAQDQASAYEADLKGANERRQAAISALGKVEADLQKFDRYRELAGDRDKETAKKQAALDLVRDHETKLAELGARAWIGVLEEDLRVKRAEIQADFEALAFEFGSRRVHQEHQRHLQDKSTCPTCMTDLDQQRRDETLGRLTREVSTTTSDSIQAELSKLSGTLTQIQETLDRSVSGQIRLLSASISSAAVEAEDAAKAVQRLERQMQGTGLDEADYQRLIEEKIKQQQIADENAQSAQVTSQRLEETQGAIRQLEKEIETAAGAKVSPEVRAASIAAGVLDSVFAEAATNAREMVQSQIRDKAEEFFLKVSANPDYAGVVLDPSYRVAVVDKDGNSVVEPSAGYRQLLVLSLVSALMRTRPQSGPVVMDMPFGRLDPQRTSGVLQALPLLSEQVIIFVFPDEAGSTALQDLGASVYAIHDIHFRGLYDSALVMRQAYAGRGAK